MSEDVKAYGAGDERDDNAAARLKELRELTEQLGFSQRGVARELELDERTVRYWFSGQYPAPLTAIYALRYLASQASKKLPDGVTVVTQEAIAMLEEMLRSTTPAEAWELVQRLHHQRRCDARPGGRGTAGR